MLRGSGTGIDFSDESGSITCNRLGGWNDCAWASWLMAIPTAPRTATARKATAILMVVIFICRGCKLVVPFMFHLEELLKPTRSLRLPSVFSPRNPLTAGSLGLSLYFALFVGHNQAGNVDSGGVRTVGGLRSNRVHNTVLHLQLVFAGQVVPLQHRGGAYPRRPSTHGRAAVLVHAEDQLAGIVRDLGVRGRVGGGVELIVARHLIQRCHVEQAAVFRHHYRGRFLGREVEGNNGCRAAGDVRSAPDAQAVRSRGEAGVLDVAVALAVGDGGDRHVVIGLVRRQQGVAGRGVAHGDRQSEVEESYSAHLLYPGNRSGDRRCRGRGEAPRHVGAHRGASGAGHGARHGGGEDRTCRQRGGGREGGDRKSGVECYGCRHRSRNRNSRSEEHTSEVQSLAYLVCRLLLEKK